MESKKIIIHVAFCTALVIGGVSSNLLIAEQQQPISTSADHSHEQALPIEDIQRFTTTISQIKRYYVKDVDDQELFENAIRGMLSGLDPHSSYLNEDDLEDLRTSTTGEFGGLGIEVGMEDGLIKVISPIDGTPAARAGIQAGDLILRLDDTPVKGMELSEAVKRMRGKKGTSIDLTIYRKSEKKPLKIKLVRDTIKIQSVKSQILDGEYGYIRISHFQEPSAARVRNAVREMIEENKKPIKGWIIDLRNNPGGLLDAAVQVSDVFLDSEKMGENKKIVYTQGKLIGAQYTEYANPGDILTKSPLVVLINEGSASASEIVAGALQDHGRALVVGQPTFGKGSVQTILPIADNAGIKLTTSLYYTPSGRSIQAEGIKPDVLIETLTISDEGQDVMAVVREAHLTGHLDKDESADPASKNNVGKASAQGANKLVHEDYQLYQALNIVKSMAAMDNMQAKASSR